MACNAPINIIKNTADICSLKCMLWYKYGNSSCTVKNNTDQLVISYDGVSDVMFNSVPYNPTEVRIFKPSLHTFDGLYADAELIIVHKGTVGGLLICIPIMATSSINASTGTNIINDIITSSNPDNTPISLNIQDFNVNNLIPKGSYFSYSGTLPYGTCAPTIYQYVVFPKNGGITISKTTLDNLGNLIHDSYIPVHEGSCFFNEKGTNSNGFAGEGQIYIDCQPTGEEGDIIYQEISVKPMSYEWLYALTYVIFGIALMYACIKVIKFVIAKIPDLNISG